MSSVEQKKLAPGAQPADHDGYKRLKEIHELMADAARKQDWGKYNSLDTERCRLYEEVMNINANLINEVKIICDALDSNKLKGNKQ